MFVSTRTSVSRCHEVPPDSRGRPRPGGHGRHSRCRLDRLRLHASRRSRRHGYPPACVRPLLPRPRRRPPPAGQEDRRSVPRVGRCAANGVRGRSPLVRTCERPDDPARDLPARPRDLSPRQPALLGRPPRVRAVRGRQPRGTGPRAHALLLGMARRDRRPRADARRRRTGPPLASHRPEPDLRSRERAWVARRRSCSSHAGRTCSSGAAALDADTDMAARYRAFRELHGGLRLQALAREEIGGAPGSDPAAYAARSPIHWARAIARSGVPLHIWWSRPRPDRAGPARRVGQALPRRSGASARAPPVTQYVGDWAHSKEFHASAQAAARAGRARTDPARRARADTRSDSAAPGLGSGGPPAHPRAWRHRSGPGRRPASPSRPRRRRSPPAPRRSSRSRVFSAIACDASRAARGARSARAARRAPGSVRSGMARVALDLRRAGQVAEDEGVRRRAVDQAKGDARIGRVQQRALPFHPEDLAAALDCPRRPAARPRRR